MMTVGEQLDTKWLSFPWQLSCFSQLTYIFLGIPLSLMTGETVHRAAIKDCLQHLAPPLHCRHVPDRTTTTYILYLCSFGVHMTQLKTTVGNSTCQQPFKIHQTLLVAVCVVFEGKAAVCGLV